MPLTTRPTISPPPNRPLLRQGWDTTLLACVLAASGMLTGCGSSAGVKDRIADTRPAQVVPSAAPVTVRLISFNDFHGNLEPAGLTLPWPDPANPQRALRLAAGGAAALAGTVQALRQTPPEPGQALLPSLVLSAGDHIGGTPLVSALFRHEPTIEAMNLIGVDVATLGNHEFDAGAAELRRMMQGGCGANAPDAKTQSCALQPFAGAKFPHVTANLTQADGSPFVAGSVVREVGGVKIGFIGAVTRSTPNIVVPSGVAGLRFGDEATAINREAKALLSQGVRALVAVIHEGGNTGMPGQPLEWNDAACPNPRGAIFSIVEKLHPEIDLVFSGHTHQGYRCVVDGRAVMQATALGRGVSVADLVIDPATGDVDRSRSTHRNLPVFNPGSDATLKAAIIAAEPPRWARALQAAVPSEAVAAHVARYSAAAAPLASKPVGRIAGHFDRSGKTDSSAGRLIADAQWRATRAPERGGARFALMNPGGVRSDLRCASGSPPCTITYGDAFTMQPFGNSLVVMTLSGAQVRQLLEDQQRPGRSAPSFLIPSSSLTYRWVAAAPHGQRVQDLRLDGSPLDPAQDVRFTVNSFLADGGDGASVLTQGRDRLGGELDIDALMVHLATGPAPDAVPRITLVE